MLRDKTDYWAHTPKEAGGDPHDLRQHLLDTAQRAQEFASAFGAGNLAYMLGLWHDLGKYNPDFQEYLRQAHKAALLGQTHRGKGPPHAIWGATYLVYKLGKHPSHETFSIPVFGHHAGLGEASDVAQKIRDAPDLNKRVEVMETSIKRYELTLIGLPENPPTTKIKQELFTRMVASALVDADFLDTERHFDQGKPEARATPLSIADLWAKFEGGREKLLKKQIGSGKIPAPHVQRVRDEVYQACLNAASKKPGIYKLTVPTGGGKTLSGLAFALKHAQINDLRRVIIGIPFTSIIDQNAKVYREVLGDDAVLEHHSAVNVKDNKTERQDPRTLQLQLATENWDVPLICTTFVQLFESLFARKTSKIRKLYRLAKSVIVLDEVQTLPAELREPTLDVLRTLVDDYGVSLVLCTATQPAFETDVFTESFKDIEQTEIVEDYKRHFELLIRVRYNKHAHYPNPAPWLVLAEEISREPQVLSIFNTRRDALALVRELQKRNCTGIYHLSTLMCGAHRQDALSTINAQLADPQKPPIRLVSTQVVEAGVDLDFPVVHRALAPLDRIVQAAGRCNRNGNDDLGQVVIFQTESGKAPKGVYQKGIEKARTILETTLDLNKALNGQGVLREYFSKLYTDVGADEKKIQPDREELNFVKVAEKYRLIVEDTVTIIVPYGDYKKHLERWRRVPGRKSWRALQPHIVSIYPNEAKKLLGAGMLDEVVPLNDGADEQNEDSPKRAVPTEDKIYLFNRADKYDAVTGLPIDRDPADLMFLEGSVV